VAAIRGRAAFLRQVQRGFVVAGFVLLISGVGGFVILAALNTRVPPLVVIAAATATGEGLGMFAIVLLLEGIFLLSPRWLREKE
jgi:hypothetical protein